MCNSKRGGCTCVWSIRIDQTLCPTLSELRGGLIYISKEMLLWEISVTLNERLGGGSHIYIQYQQLKCEGPHLISHSKVKASPIYIYIYIEREREREREHCSTKLKLMLVGPTLGPSKLIKHITLLYYTCPPTFGQIRIYWTVGSIMYQSE